MRFTILENKTYLNNLNGDILKLTAAVAMLIDHVGAILYPHILFLRIVGRIAFPVFSFFVAEACYYTKNKIRYLSNLLLFASATQIVKVVFNDNDDLNIMFTFAAGAVVIFALQLFAESIHKKGAAFLILVLAAVVFLVWALNRVFVFQYDFCGCIAPCIIYLANYVKSDVLSKFQLKLLMLCVALTVVYFAYGGVQICAYAAVFPLMFYSGKKGERVPKYFFYIFYPSHLAVLYLLKNFI